MWGTVSEKGKGKKKETKESGNAPDPPHSKTLRERKRGRP